MTPQRQYRSSPTITVNGESIDLTSLHGAGWCGTGGDRALVLILKNPDSPTFDEVADTRVLVGSLADSAWRRVAPRAQDTSL